MQPTINISKLKILSKLLISQSKFSGPQKIYFEISEFAISRVEMERKKEKRQRIHLKHQALFSSKDKSKKLKCRLQQFLFGALRVSTVSHSCNS